MCVCVCVCVCEQACSFLTCNMRSVCINALIYVLPTTNTKPATPSGACF